MNATSTNPILTLENEAFSFYLLTASLLILKVLGVPLLTIFQRMKSKLFISSEDAEWKNGQVGTNEQVDRTRRAHLNDLENIPIFLIAGLAYLWTEPNPIFAAVLYFGFLACRVVHTFVYAVIVVRQPTRAVMWAIGYIITGYMAIHTTLHVFIGLVKN